MDFLFGYIEKITFYNPENGFTVAKIKQPNKQDLITIVGNLPPLQPGENVRLTGEWKRNPTHGIQLEVKECKIDAPTDLAGIQKYLESGMIRGIGPAFAKKIIKEFGLRTLDVLNSSPEELEKVEGLGVKRVEKIKECWQEHKSVREVILFLQKFEISHSFAQRVYRVYKEKSIAKIQENPYLLAQEIAGIGFKTADSIAKKMGYTNETSSRIDAGIEYVLMQFADEGHVCYPKAPFVEEAQKILEVAPALILERIDTLIESNRLILETVEETPYLFIKGLYLCEIGIQRELARLRRGHCLLRTFDCDKALEWVEKILHLELAPLQREAVKSSLTEKVHIITGGPGTGKSTITQAILTISRKLTSQIILAAPTGRAAERLTEITKKDASTIHSLLQYDFQAKGFKRNKENPLQCDLIIVDEASMIDTSLMYHLLKAIPTHARLILVGDIHQLPSVGPGNVLKEFIASQTVAVTTLTEIFRQAKGSKIITNAHRINEGRFPEITAEEKGDFLFFKLEEPTSIVEKILSLVCKEIPSQYRLDPFKDIQVLAPMKKGVIGIENLNHALKKGLNPSNHSFHYRGIEFSLGDKVMQIRNNYQKEVYNGDLGRIKKIDHEEQEILVAFSRHEVTYTALELEELRLAYATSIHKFQGSEAACVVIPIHTSHYMMLYRNLLYTAVTRGKKLVVLVGTTKALAIAVSQDKIQQRYTTLKYQLQRDAFAPC